MRRVLLASLGSVFALAGGGGTVVVKAKPFLAEVAVTDREKAKGLMYRQSLAKDRCMIFLGNEDATRPIRTKSNLIALDVVWIDSEGHVVETAEHVQPCSPMRGDDCPSFGGKVPARHYIEFPAGTFKRLGLKKGDRLGWELTLDDGHGLRGGLPIPKTRKK
jgi:uncharacterized membrane protein (UPF0127 family)